MGEVTGSGGKQQFTYDHVFGDQQTTDQLYDEVLSDVVKSTVNGFNGTIFAYSPVMQCYQFCLRIVVAAHARRKHCRF